MGHGGSAEGIRHVERAEERQSYRGRAIGEREGEPRARRSRLDVRCPDVGGAAVRAVGDDRRRTSVVTHRPRGRIVGVDDRDASALRDALEEDRLGATIGLDAAMEVEVVLRDEGDRADGERHGIQPIQGQPLGRGFENRPPVAGVDHAAQ